MPKPVEMSKKDTAACMAWIAENKCPHCRNEAKCTTNRMKGYKMGPAYNGYKCGGYRSRHWDERGWADEGR